MTNCISLIFSPKPIKNKMIFGANSHILFTFHQLIPKFLYSLTIYVIFYLFEFILEKINFFEEPIYLY
jgi:hypothetical protein